MGNASCADSRSKLVGRKFPQEMEGFFENRYLHQKHVESLKSLHRLLGVIKAF